MSVQDFIKTYYIDPIVLNQGYNFVNTFTYAILVVLVTWFTFKFLEKIKVKADKKFVIGFLPMILFGVTIRLFEEAGISKSYFLVTPMIWIEMFAAIFLIFLLSRFIEKKFKIPYYKTLFLTGIVLAIIPFLVLAARIVQLNGIMIALGVLAPFALVMYFVRWKRENKWVALAHIFDSTTTFTAVQFFGFRELHVVPRLLIGTLSPVSFVIVKVLVVVGVLILIDRYSDDRNFNNFLKFIIAIIGFAPGLRDLYLLGLIS